jgi:uncharacterized protein YlxW (UPF0749 family)
MTSENRGGLSRDGLIARIRQMRRHGPVRDQRSANADASLAEQLRSIEARVAHLEQMVEGLQDSVHRESQRYDKQIADLQAQIQPGAMGAALADDARHRGL